MSMPLDPNTMFSEPRSLSRSAAAAIAATGSLVVGTLDARRKVRIDRVEIMSDADYADHAANYYTLTLQAGATVLATWSTVTGAEGAITGLTPAAMTLTVTDANLVLAAGAALKLVATKASSAANITPQVVVYGHTVG